MLDLRPIVRAVLNGYTLPPDGIHGVAHWARVLENGLKMAEAAGADVDVVRLFAVFHDARRVNEATDPGHGLRGADLARSLHGRLFDLPDGRFDLLYRACAGHTDERTDPDPTIRACWDADRLDLGRVGITPDPFWLGTDLARRPGTIRWADGRARFQVVPDLVRDEWGVKLSEQRLKQGES